MENKEIITKINEVIDKIRPYLQADGGDIKLNKYENYSIGWLKHTINYLLCQ